MSQVSSSPIGSKRDNKWSTETELCQFGSSANRISSKAERRPSSKPIPMPERKCSTDRFFDLSTEETPNSALLKSRRPKQQQENPIDKFWSKKHKRLPSRPPITQGSRGRMANAKWDLNGSGQGGDVKRNSKWNFPQNESGPSIGTMLSTIVSSGSSSAGRQTLQSNNDCSKMSTSFSRISMTGSIFEGLIEGSIAEGSIDLRKPTRKRSQGHGLNKTVHSTPDIMSPVSMASSSGHQHAQRRASCHHHSTMPLTMPVRKTSTQDLLYLTSSSSKNALRSKLSQSKLHNAAYNPMVPRRIGSASSMVRNQSREHLRRHA